MPDISVVMSTYNRRAMLLPAVHCALGQRDVDHEVIVVDNGSSDGTWEALQRLDHPRLRLLRNDVSRGPTGGRNTGLAAARGRWVGILDDDDLWAPTKLAEQVAEAARTGRHWVYSGCVYIDERRRIIGGSPPLSPEEVVERLPRNYVVPGGMSSMLWQRDRLDGDGLLDERFTMTTDWDVALRLLRAGPPAAVARPSVGYRQHHHNVSKGAAGFQHELDVIEEKFSDLLEGARVDRAAQWRFVGSEALRAGDRQAAVVAYRRAATAGDPGALARSLAVLAPRRLHPLLRRRLLSERAWLAEAGTWLRELERGPAAPRPTVLFVQRSLRRYREPFYEEVRDLLLGRGIEVELVHSNGHLETERGDAGRVAWARQVPARSIGGRRSLVWQACLRQVLAADLVVTEQASRLLLNYLLVARRLVGLRPRFALWGHGRAFDTEGASGVGEAIKRWMSRHADWWFAYTEEVADVVAQLGYPSERITSVDNSTDTAALKDHCARTTAADADAVRRELGLGTGPLGMYTGTLHPSKRLPFLWEAVAQVREKVPGFELVVVGDGMDRDEVEAYAAGAEGVVYAGQRFGRDLAVLARAVDLLLVPSGAGLVIVDAFALGVPPVVSTSFPHGPERAYIRHGVNGLAVDDDADPSRYADAVVAVLEEPAVLADLVAGCRRSADRYTIENMAHRFAGGIEAALGPRWSR